MTPEQKAAYIQSECVSALVAIEAMKADNAIRAYRGLEPQYGADAFYDVQRQYYISHNDVIGLFRDY